MEMKMKQMAQRTLKAIADNYQRLIEERERLEQETRLIDETEATGDSVGAQNHRILTGVYTDGWSRMKKSQYAQNKAYNFIQSTCSERENF
jgi:hypothetical protein